VSQQTLLTNIDRHGSQIIPRIRELLAAASKHRSRTVVS
jgi:hypothetical protein